MNRIQVVSRVARTLLIILLVIGPLGVAVSWATRGGFLGGFNLDMLPNNLNIGELPSIVKFYGFLISLLPTALGMLIIYYFVRLFGQYERGEIFTVGNARCFKGAAITILIWQVIHPFYDMLMSYTLTMNSAEPQIVYQFALANLRGVIIAVLLYVIGWVMEEARTMKEEQDYTV